MIGRVQITAAETVGIQGRASYYESSGALRDVVPNHMAELLSLVVMEPPVSFSADHRPCAFLSKSFCPVSGLAASMGSANPIAPR